MRSITVLHNQSLLDICIQVYGSLEALFDLALANNLSTTVSIAAGTVLNAPISDYTNQDVLNYYSARKVTPATALSSDSLTILENNDPCDLCALFK